MNAFSVIRVVLSVTFASAAAGKLADRAAFRRATAALGVPAGMAWPVAAVTPWVEVGICGALLPGRTARAGAIVGLSLTLAFTGLLAANLIQGKRPTCNCFGARNDAPISGWSLARNGVILAGFAVVALDRRPIGVGRGTVDFALAHFSAETAIVVLAGLVALEAFALAQMWLRPRQAAAPVAPEDAYGLPVGTPAPDFLLPDLDGVDRSLESLTRAGNTTLVAFVDPQCGPCEALLPELADWQHGYGDALSIVIVSRGGVDENRRKLGDLALAPVLLQEADEVAAAFATRATPSAVLVSASGRVMTSAVGTHAIRRIVEDVLATTGSPAWESPTPPIGSDAPLFAVPSMRGGQDVSLLAARGRLTLVVFWSPTCGFCNALAHQLREWELRLHPGHGPQLVVLSDGSPTASDTPFTTVGLDAGQLLRRAYGVSGTPMAVLVDAQGKLASDVVGGADETMALARRAESLSTVAQRVSGRSKRIPVVADQA